MGIADKRINDVNLHYEEINAQREMKAEMNKAKGEWNRSTRGVQDKDQIKMAQQKYEASTGAAFERNNAKMEQIQIAKDAIKNLQDMQQNPVVVKPRLITNGPI